METVIPPKQLLNDNTAIIKNICEKYGLVFDDKFITVNITIQILSELVYHRQFASLLGKVVRCKCIQTHHNLEVQ